MECRNCGANMAEDAKFCVQCGTKVSTALVCKHCGVQIEKTDKFCPQCGLRTWTESAPGEKAIVQQVTPVEDQDGLYTGSKTIGAYWTTAIGAIVTFFLRLVLQDEYHTWSNLLDGRYIIGLAEEIKPFVTIIPILVTIIASLLLTTDTDTSKQRKKVAFIWNAVLIALSVLFIWFDLPRDLFDF